MLQAKKDDLECGEGKLGMSMLATFLESLRPTAGVIVSPTKVGMFVSLSPVHVCIASVI